MVQTMVFAADSIRVPDTRVCVSVSIELTYIHARTRLSEIIALVSHWFIHAVLKQPHVIRDYHPY